MARVHRKERHAPCLRLGTFLHVCPPRVNRRHGQSMPQQVTLLMACCKMRTNSSLPTDLIEYPTALKTFLFQSAVRTSLIKSQTALRHSDMGGMVSSSFSMLPMTNPRSNLMSYAKFGRPCTPFLSPKSRLTPARSPCLAKLTLHSVCGSTSN